jgi:hypothetical protein
LFDLEDPHFNFRLVTAQIIHEECPRDTITSLIVDTLLAPEYQLRQASALLAFNVAWTCTQVRSFIELPCTEYDEHWTSEITAALSTAIANETTSESKNDETAFRLISAVGLLIAFSSPAVVELAQIVGLEAHLQKHCSLKRNLHQELIPKICKEVNSILKQ